MAHDIWLVRHGETAWSSSLRHTGRTDVPLIEEGRSQAVALAPRLLRLQPALVLSSPLARAADTARLAGLAPELDDDLREWDYGTNEGRTTSEIRVERPGWTVWDGPNPGGETAADVGRRADRVIARCRAAGGPALLVAHGHLLRILAARWLDLAPEAGRLLALGAGSVSTLGWEREQPTLTLWNDRHHLS